MNKKREEGVCSLCLIRNPVSCEIQKTGASGDCVQGFQTSQVTRGSNGFLPVRDHSLSVTPVQLPRLLGWLNVSISFCLCQPPFSGYTGARVPKCFNQRSSEPAPRKYCFAGVSPARQTREAVLPGPQWRDSPTPHAQQYPCVLQPGCCPTSPAASTNVTLYPQPPPTPQLASVAVSLRQRN